MAFLDADQAVRTSAPSLVSDDVGRLTVLVVAEEADVRHYVRECLRERADLRCIEAATVAAARAVATEIGPALLIVDDVEGTVLATSLQLRAIVLVDDAPHDASGSGSRIRFLARPFTTRGLVAEVVELLR